MDPDRFISTAMGRVVQASGRLGFSYFQPEPIPRGVDFDSRTVAALSAADNALGRLAGAGRHLPNPHLMARPYVFQEAVSSSRIEGTQTSLSEVLRAAAAGTSAPDSEVREVENYVQAMEQGLDLLTDLPVCGRLVKRMHAVLLQGARGRDKSPGEFRRSPVWIGSPTDRPDNATYVPPLAESVPDLVSDWDHFANEDSLLPPLVRCALLHYQFETIHPFLDGNGRLGRLFIVFFLVQQQRLPQPLFYISAYFEDHRQEYYDRLQAVRERGELQEWLQFFLTAVAAQAQDAVAKSEALFDVRERYRAELARSRSRAVEVVDLLFGNPFITAGGVEDRLGISNQGAINLIRQLESKEWLVQVGRFGRGGRRFWVAPEIMSIVEGTASVRQEPGEAAPTVSAE